MNAAVRYLFVLVMALQGCAGETVLSVPASAPAEMRVTWVRGTASEVAFYCSTVSNRLRALNSPDAVACTDANPARGSCVVYSTDNVTLATLGDELAHCYLGAWHH